jgi:hypothetical protein
MEMVWAWRLELGHQETMAEVCDRQRTDRPEGANERSVKMESFDVKKFIL